MRVFINILLLWNFFKLFQIGADPIIQLLNGLLSMGIYFDCFEKDLNIKSFRRLNVILGTVFLSTTIIRSLILVSPLDKYYYLLLPFGICSISFMGKNFKDISNFKNMIIISFLLPIRRVFFYLVNPLLMVLTKYLTLLALFCLGVNPILEGNSIVLGRSVLVISQGCGGSDNMYFVIATITIYFLTFKLRSKSNLIIIYLITFIVPLLVNISRNTLLALIIRLDSENKDLFFIFFHDSYGSLIFSLISVLIVSYTYFKLLDNELSS